MSPREKSASASREPSARVRDATRWAAELGAISAEALAIRTDTAVASSRAVLRAGRQARLLASTRPLHGRSTLYTATASGLRATDTQLLGMGRVSASNAAHLMAVAEVAAILGQRHPDHRVQGERELRRDEHAVGRALASARVGSNDDGSPALHRADLILWPSGPGDERPVAVEVELTVKAPRRLAAICRAWARCPLVGGVLYYAPPEVQRALERAVQEAQAAPTVVVLPIDAVIAGPR